MRPIEGQRSFGDWLRKRRKELDLTQFDLAERIGCSEDTIQKIETGERRPSKQVAGILADYFNVQSEEHEAFFLFARGRADALVGTETRAQGALEYHAKVATKGDPDPQARHKNLPMQLTSFIGRDEELPSICRLLLTPGVRLLTLTGPPGTGKTRLALQVAARLLDEFEDGAYFVNLAPISDPGLVVSEILRSLDAPGSGSDGRSPVGLVTAYLMDRRLLLVLDNFEHILDAAPVVVRLLGACPRLSVLVTSREPLHIAGEQQFPVPPLRAPNLSRLPGWQELLDFPAVELFVQRAAAIDPTFKLTQENHKEVAMICARLEGLPLAIELAAARIKFFSPQALLARLGSNLTILAGEVLALPARQQTLRGAIEWSSDLLTDGEKKLFRRLAVFAGGRTIEAVEAVCNAGGDLGMDVTEGLISLTDKSLLRQEAGVGSEPRFVMPETIYEYAREKLRRSGEEGSIRRLHALYFAEFAEQADLKLYGTSESRSLDHLEEEHDNLRNAIQWSHSPEGDAEIELRLVAALGAFWDTRGHLTEGRMRIAAALARPESRQVGLRSLRAWALIGLGGLAYWQGDFVTSRSSAEDALSLFRELGETQGITRALTDLWGTATAEGDHESSVAFAIEGLQTSREFGDEQRTALLLVLLGWSQMYLGKYTQAVVQLEEALKLVRKQDQPNRTAFALAALGEVMVRQGNYDQGVRLLEEALAIRRNTGYRSRIAAILGGLALAAIRQEQYGRAVERLSESLKIRKEIGDRGGVAWCLEKFVQIISANVEDADPTRAARLLGAAGALREALGTAMNTIDQAEYDQTVNIVIGCLGQEAFRRAWQEGLAMGIEEIVEYALR